MIQSKKGYHESPDLGLDNHEGMAESVPRAAENPCSTCPAHLTCARSYFGRRRPKAQPIPDSI